MKQCNTCKIEKDKSEFGSKKFKSGNYGLTHECKVCKSARASARYATESVEDRERRISLRSKWRESNRDVVNGLKRKYNLQKKVIKLSSMPHDHHVKAYQSYTFQQSLIRHDQHVKEWKSFIKYAVYQRLKRGVQRGMRGKAANSNWSDYLGYSVYELIDHIEAQFIDGMGWHNMSEWHIDHILPIRSFDLNHVDSEEFKRCYSLDNLRPVWAEDNMNKYYNSDKYMIIKQKKVLGRFFLHAGN